MNFKKIVLAGIGVAASSLLLAGCASTPPATNNKTEKALTTLEETTWGSYNPDDASRGEAHITFSSDGEVYGNDGCNSFFGTYSLERDSISGVLGPMGATMMYCEGVDQWLTHATSFKYENGVVVFTGVEGKVGELEQSKSYNAKDEPADSADIADGNADGLATNGNDEEIKREATSGDGVSSQSEGESEEDETPDGVVLTD